MMFYLNKIKLTNFRCYQSYSTNFIPHINIIVGNNALGKTSLVEAIYCLGLTKSHKASNDVEMIKNNKEVAVIKGLFKMVKNKMRLFYQYRKKGKKLIRITKQNQL